VQIPDKRRAVSFEVEIIKKAPGYGIVRTRVRSIPYILKTFPPSIIIQLCIKFGHLCNIFT